MIKGLVIAEKPSVARDMKTAYEHMTNCKYTLDFTSCRGHIVGLCLPDEYKNMPWGKPWNEDVLPMIPEEWQTKILDKDYLQNIQDMINTNNYDFICNACDAGREGELIFYNVYEKLKINLPALRYWADDTTEKTIQKSLNNLYDEKDFVNLKNSAKLRSYSDWLVGMNFSRMARMKTGINLNIGRVMTPLLCMITNRTLENENFVPEPYYLLNATYNKDTSAYVGTLCENDDKEFPLIKLKTKENAQKIISSLSKSAEIIKLDSKKEIILPSQLFNIADLQKAGAKYFNYSPDKTLSITQSLYDKHYLSYPRTDSKYLSQNVAEEIPEKLKHLLAISDYSAVINNIIGNTKSINETLKNKRYVDDSKLTDHHAIIPTDTVPDLSKLSSDERNIYTLVLKRFISIFLKPHISNKLILITKNSDYYFKTQGKTVVQNGWYDFFGKTEQDVELPTVSMNDVVDYINSEIEEKMTTPPALFNYSTLISAMEKAGNLLEDESEKEILKNCKGIGTGATRSEIIKKLFNCEYIELNKKNILPTHLGRKIVEIIGSYDFASPKLTADWELRLSKIEDGTLSFEEYYKDMIEYIKKDTSILSSLKKVEDASLIKTNTSIGKCPICGADVKHNKKAYFCVNFTKRNDKNVPECKFVLSKTVAGTTITENQLLKLITSGQTDEISFHSKTGLFKRKLILNKESENLIEFSKSEVKQIGQCPKCSKPLMSSSKYIYCSCFKNGCDFIFPKIIDKYVLNDSETEKILNKEKVNINNVNYYLDENLKLKHDDIFICKCPICGKNVIETPKAYCCENNNRDVHDCKFIIWKNIKGSAITPNNAKDLSLGKKISKTFTWKSGKKSKAEMIYNLSTNKTEFVFENDK